MTPSPWLFDLLKARLPFRPTAWRACRHAPWTLGYGHTEGAQPGDTCTMEQAEELLRYDIARAAERHAGAVSQHQFDALVALSAMGVEL